MKYVFLIIFFHCFSGFSASFDDFLVALSQVESSHNNNAVGDGGRSLGKYQITKLYFEDAKKQDVGLRKYTHTDCFDPNIARRVVTAYMWKYEARAMRNKDWEALARLHNSGPNWRNKKHLTDGYWNKIRLAMGN